MKKIAITTGDPAGIGPEIASKELRFHPLKDDCIYIVYGTLPEQYKFSNIKHITSIAEAVSAKTIYYIEIHKKVPNGIPSRESGKIAFEILERCSDDLLAGFIDTVVTCPVSKQAIQLEHPEFIGHTEYFAQKTNSKNVTMTFWSQYFHLALLTTHHSICEAAGFLSPEFLESKLQVIVKQFTKFYQTCRFAVLGINPHAGEAGAFGKEDGFLFKIINKMQKEGIDIHGPFPADTFFVHHVTDFQIVISAFHDQGLIPFKMLGADHGVNVTLGLPFLRVSVDHGTAYDIAGKGIAEVGSFESALMFAENGCFLRESNSIYGRFAPFYDNYMKHVNYDNWVEFILKKHRDFRKKEPQKILELACGTGNITIRLDSHEREVFGMDNSPEMLKIAERKNHNINFFLGDFTKPLQYFDFDIILLLFDSINYLHEPQKLMDLFQVVYQALQKEGLFIFDISTVLNCEENFDGFVNLEEDLHSYMIHQSVFDYDSRILKTKLTFFIRKGFIYERYDEVHFQKIFLCTELIELIEKTSFKLVGVFSRHSSRNFINKINNDLDRTYQRLYFVLQK
jgi:4-hydroxythreonine-4-phosphate dehydrogenase